MKRAAPEAKAGRREAVARAAALILALAAASAVRAQVVTDPTRPPAGFDTPAPEAAGEAGGGMRLQSVMISPTHRSAIISGVTVALGEKFGDAVLIKVTETAVVLRSGNENRVLKLYPGVEKREVKPKTASAARNDGPKRGVAGRK